MTQVVLNISSKKKWNALKSVLEAMEIDYSANETSAESDERELQLLRMAQNDVQEGRVSVYTNHRAILGK